MKTRRSLRSAATLLLVSLAPQLVALPALAQGAPSDDPVTIQARARFKEGVDYFDKGQYENARISFLQAYALKKHPAVLLNLAQSAAKANHPLEAARYFQQFLREANEATPQQRKDAESGLAEVRQKLGRIEIVAPAGTEVVLDDKERLGTAPFAEPVDVEPGPHVLKSSAETVRVGVSAGAKVPAHFGPATGAPPPVAAPVPLATPEKAPAAPAATPSEPIEETPPPAAPVKRTNLLSPPENMTPVYVGLAAGGVGLVSAIMFGIFKGSAQGKADDVANGIRAAADERGVPREGICSNPRADIQQDFGKACQTLADNNSAVDTNATIANVSLVVMGVGLLTAGGWYLFAPKSGDQSQRGATTKPTFVASPYGGYRSAGFSLSGSF